MHPIWGLVLAVIPAAYADAPRKAVVAAEFVDVLDEPDDAAFSTGRLARGRKVTIVRDGPDGWSTIAPPEDSFSFIEESDLEDLGDGRARILTQYASVRPGRERAKLPGPPRVSLKQGTMVTLLDRRPLVRRQGQSVQTWIAIAPPPSEVRFVRASSLAEEEEERPAAPPPTRRKRLTAQRDDEDPEDPTGLSPAPRSTPMMVGVGAIDAGFLAVEPEDPEVGISPEVAAKMRAIADAHRSEVRRPIDRWNLAPIDASYRLLLKDGVEANERRAIEDRLARVRRQDSAAKAAARIADLVARSRSRDGETASKPRNDPEESPDSKKEYDATGLLQRTSTVVNGQKVHALLGDSGSVVAYLSIPPGLSVEPLMSHRVGVRGEGRYEESLRTRLILVKDLEPYEPPPKPAKRTPIRP